MLVLTRKLGETIIIYDNIKITVIGVSGKQVKLGIDAPKGVPIHREEVFEKIKNENILATKWSINLKEFKDIFKKQE